MYLYVCRSNVFKCFCILAESAYSFFMSVHLSVRLSASIIAISGGRIAMKFDTTEDCCENLPRKSKFWLRPDNKQYWAL